MEEELTARSPLEKYDDVEKELRERWEDELKAAIEAEYRRQRADLLLVGAMVVAGRLVAYVGGRAGVLEFSQGRGAEPGGGAALVARRLWRICRWWSKPSGCSTPTCRRP